MVPTCYVVVSVRRTTPESRPVVTELGEWSAVWQHGVSIGSDPQCTVVLDGLAPVAARAVAASNHILLYWMPEGTSLPLPPLKRWVEPYDERVDTREFQLGSYRIRFSELDEGPVSGSRARP